MKKIKKEINQQKIMIYVLAAFIIFWNIASVLGLIAFFRTNNSNENITALAAENSGNIQVPYVEDRISLPFLDGAIVSTKESIRGETSSTIVNVALTRWNFNSTVSALAGFGRFTFPVQFVGNVNTGTNVSSTGLNIGYVWVSSSSMSSRADCVCAQSYNNIVVNGVPQYTTIYFNFNRGTTNDEDNISLINWLYANCTLSYAPASAYQSDDSDTSSWYNISTFAFKPINSSSTYLYDTYSEELVTLSIDDLLGYKMSFNAYSSLSDFTFKRPRMVAFMYSNTVNDFTNVIPLGYVLKLKNISGTTKGFVADIRYFKVVDSELVDVGTLSLGFGFYTEPATFVFPYIHRTIGESMWDLVPDIGDDYLIGTYSFHSANNCAYFLNSTDELQYWIDQYNALLRNYNTAYSKGESAGYENGYNIGYGVGESVGYNKGLSSSNAYSFNSLLSAVLDVPVNTFTSLFNFDLLGVNLANFFLSLLTVCVIITVVRLLL